MESTRDSLNQLSGRIKEEPIDYSFNKPVNCYNNDSNQFNSCSRHYDIPSIKSEQTMESTRDVLNELNSGIKEEPIDYSCDKPVNFFQNDSNHLTSCSCNHEKPSVKSEQSEFWVTTSTGETDTQHEPTINSNDDEESKERNATKLVYNNCFAKFKTTETPAIPKLFRCQFCFAMFSDKSIYKIHSLLHQKEAIYQCDACSAKFTRQNKLKRHLLIHHVEKTVTCDLCSAKLSQIDNLKKHILSHLGDDRFMCNICSAQLSSARNLRQHSLLHNDKAKFKCPICSSSFTSAGNLKIHLKIHSGEKRHECNICSARFTQAGNLKQHMSLHTTGDEKQYKCDLCPASFAQASYLKKHQLFHSERNFECDRCSAKFYRASDLKRHYRIHTGEKPYTCNLCLDSFKRPRDLKRHTRLKHSEHSQEVDTSDIVSKILQICPITESTIVKSTNEKISHKLSNDSAPNFSDNKTSPLPRNVLT